MRLVLSTSQRTICVSFKYRYMQDSWNNALIIHVECNKYFLKINNYLVVYVDDA